MGIPLNRYRKKEDGLFECKVCHKQFESTNQVGYHYVKEHRQAKDSKICKVCDKTFSCKGALKLHMTSRHGETQPQYPCSLSFVTRFLKERMY